ncbi:Gfo/Idh/MocA family protein [candidate division CSSED10-310 bacterium]|uniref:Gfo/Idh/MocA family protein n=1 Tax=candidate division CSSED10-310 bacterium TaxID=2855610 RepID=A0ABV6YX53_UNCC1
MISKINVAAIGVGHLGQHHARIYSEHPDCNLIGVVDTDPAQAETIAHKYQAQAFHDYRDVVGRVDAVSIATPTETHYEIAKYFLSQGIHVLLEKPISNIIAEAQELVSLSHEKNLILQIGHLERFNAALQEAKKLISNPGFIETSRLGSFSPRSLDIDVILDLMIHDIDIVLSLVKSPITSISAVGVPVLTDKVDIANARLIFESGCVVNMTASRVSLEKTRKIRIFQKQLYISVDYATQNLFVCRPVPPTPENKLAYPSITKDNVTVQPGEPLKAEIHSFVQCIATNSQPLVTAEDGLTALGIAYEILNHMKPTAIPGNQHETTGPSN